MLFIIFIRVGPLTSFKTYKQQQQKNTPLALMCSILLQLSQHILQFSQEILEFKKKKKTFSVHVIYCIHYFDLFTFKYCFSKSCFILFLNLLPDI